MKIVKAFTLAEVLITLAIIGVVAALTIPSVIVNYQKNVYVTQLKKTYNYLSNGFKTMMARDGVTRLSDTNLWVKMPDDGLTDKEFLSNEGKEAREEFLKVFNTAKTYNEATIPDNFKIAYKGLNCNSCEASPVDIGIYLNDGVWLVAAFNKTPNNSRCNDHLCETLKEFQEYKHGPAKLWQRVGTVTVDVNGPKGPNIWGRDVFNFYIGNDGNVYPQFGTEMAMLVKSCAFDNISACSTYWKNNTSKQYNCDTQSESYGYGCAARIMEEGWKMNY